MIFSTATFHINAPCPEGAPAYRQAGTNHENPPYHPLVLIPSIMGDQDDARVVFWKKSYYFSLDIGERVC